MEFKYDLNDYKIEVKNQKMFKINDRSNIFHLILKEEKTNITCDIDLFIDNSKITDVIKHIVYQKNQVRFYKDFEQIFLFNCEQKARNLFHC